MSALTQKFNKINLSMNYDGITIYPQFEVGGGLGLAIIKCVDRGIFLPVIAQEPYTKDGTAYNEGCMAINKNNTSFNRFIHRDDDDHKFYHQDTFSENTVHSHLKFKHMLTPQLCKEMLDIFAEYGILSQAETQIFMQQYTARYVTPKIQLRDQLTGYKAKDLTIITRFVAGCGDNDILAHLHTYLNSNDFAYLRYPIDSKWQGIDTNGNLENINAEWAMIEKGIALQMAKNVEVNTKYTSKVAEERATQLKEDQPFFSIKRKALHGNNTSKMFQEFRDHNTADFDHSYEKHMSRYTR